LTVGLDDLRGLFSLNDCKTGNKRDCCEAKNPQHRVVIMYWETKGRNKEIKLDSGCANKYSF